MSGGALAQVRTQVPPRPHSIASSSSFFCEPTLRGTKKPRQRSSVHAVHLRDGLSPATALRRLRRPQRPRSRRTSSRISSRRRVRRYVLRIQFDGLPQIRKADPPGAIGLSATLTPLRPSALPRRSGRPGANTGPAKSGWPATESAIAWCPPSMTRTRTELHPERTAEVTESFAAPGGPSRKSGQRKTLQSRAPPSNR